MKYIILTTLFGVMGIMYHHDRGISLKKTILNNIPPGGKIADYPIFNRHGRMIGRKSLVITNNSYTVAVVSSPDLKAFHNMVMNYNNNVLLMRGSHMLASIPYYGLRPWYPIPYLSKYQSNVLNMYPLQYGDHKKACVEILMSHGAALGAKADIYCWCHRNGLKRVFRTRAATQIKFYYIKRKLTIRYGFQRYRGQKHERPSYQRWDGKEFRNCSQKLCSYKKNDHVSMPFHLIGWLKVWRKYKGQYQTVADVARAFMPEHAHMIHADAVRINSHQSAIVSLCDIVRHHSSIALLSVLFKLENGQYSDIFQSSYYNS